MVKIVHLQNKSEEKTIMYFKTILPFKSAITRLLRYNSSDEWGMFVKRALERLKSVAFPW